jgi:hypothetical protein
MTLADGTDATRLFFVDVCAAGDAFSGKTSLRTLDGTVYCFGANDNYGCSVKKPTHVYKPVKVCLFFSFAFAFAFVFIFVLVFIYLFILFIYLFYLFILLLLLLFFFLTTINSLGLHG